MCRRRRRSPSCCCFLIPYILSIIGFFADCILTLSPIQEHRFGMIELSFILGHAARAAVTDPAILGIERGTTGSLLRQPGGQLTQ